MKGATYWITPPPPKTAKTTSWITLGGEGVEAPVVHQWCRQAQPVFVLQGELAVWLQLESQVRDGVHRRPPLLAVG